MVLALPPLILFGAFVIAPIAVSVFYSLTNWDGVKTEFGFAGLKNYEHLVGDAEVLDAFKVTLLIALVASLIVNLIGLPVAVLLDRSDLVTRFYRSVIFYPLMLSALVVAFIGQGMLSTEGIVNLVLGSHIPFLGTRWMAVASITGVAVWHTLGFTTLMYVAALKALPDHLREASTLDGANEAQRFRFVTLPMLGPAIAAVTMLLVVYLMRLYEYVLVLTLGGPAGATQTVGFTMVLNAFTRNQYAYGSAIGIALLVMVLCLVMVALKLAQRLRYD